MRLISLELENFRQHKDTRINFSDGITIINGSNGSGKSTILEAISWAIYGTEAARGNKDSIKWNKAPARSKVKVELTFALDNETYKVIRWLDKAEIYLDTNPAPIVTTQQEITKYLTDKLGMTKDEFFNTYFTGQKELNFLGNQKPIERRKFISKVLNYEKVRESQEKVRSDKNNITNEILGIKQGLGNIEILENEKNESQEKLSVASKNLEIKQAELKDYKAKLGELLPSWSKVKTLKEDFNRYNTELKYTIDKLNDIEKNIENLKSENADLELKTKRLEELEKHLDQYKKTEAKIQELEKLQKHEYEKQKLLVQLENINQDLSQHEKKLEELSKLTEANRNIPAQILVIQGEMDKLKLTVQDETRQWLSKKQEIKTLISQKEKELNKVATQSSIIEQKGEDGACPTCERTLKGEFEKVTSHFKEVIQDISKEIQELVNQEESLHSEPEIITTSRSKLEHYEKKFQDFSKIQGQYEEKIKLAETLKTEIIKKKGLKETIEENLKKIPEGFDRELLEKLKDEFADLKKIYDEILGLKAQTMNKDRIKIVLDAATKNKQEEINKKTELENKTKQLNYSEEEYKNLEELVFNTEKAANQVQYEVVKAEGEVKEINALLNRILEAEKAYKDKQKLIKSKQEELNYLIELDRFYGYFLEKLNNQARPELSEYASKFLMELTDGRYSHLELNDKYEICLYDDGEVKPVISGGEEDIANLCIRLAISQMIAQRSGRSLSLLILDEVFGSLDENRRNNVVSLLYSLTNNFEQVILITHIEDIKEGIDNIIKVEYDEEQGCSIVTSSGLYSLEDIGLSKPEQLELI
ncbi:MAG: hypothetical protein ACD_20C00127G0004 [uncultured bacterium]|nr:MAG: hypothetical protein ACD_20C00127G0004 [uncultured bacterium]HBH18476.1 hypothetical protein [Cyanobacteria bacterium UBA9579]